MSTALGLTGFIALVVFWDGKTGVRKPGGVGEIRQLQCHFFMREGARARVRAVHSVSSSFATRSFRHTGGSVRRRIQASALGFARCWSGGFKHTIHTYFSQMFSFAILRCLGQGIIMRPCQKTSVYLLNTI